MKLCKEQIKEKKRLNLVCHSLGFEELRMLVKLSGSSLGQYLAHNCSAMIPEAKLRLAEAEYKLSCQDSSELS